MVDAALVELSNYDESESLLLESYELLRNNAGARPSLVATSRQYLVNLYSAWNRPEEAARYSAGFANEP